MRIAKATYQAIQDQAGDLQVPAGLDPATLLMAISLVESSGGLNNHPRVEKSYQPGGRYCDQAQYDLYGDDAAASWGPWQIMYVTARELGYEGQPQDLARPEVSLPLVIKLINRRITGRGAASLEQIADAYNSGSFRDQIVPQGYIAKLKQAYQDLAALAPEVVEQAG